MFNRPPSLERLRAAVRQWAYPLEFRIAEAVWPEDVAGRLREALQRRPPQSPVGGLTEEQIKAVGTRLWRLRSEVEMSAGGQVGDIPGRARRHLEALWEQLAEAGIDIFDHTGEIMPEGVILLKVIAHQPTRGVTRKRVIETVRPTIRFNGQIIQVGEVIVGTPERRS
jgi:hypothetical protein